MASSVTIERILDASLKLFNEEGFQSVSILKIANRAGISPGNLSYHFKSKTDIVLSVFPSLEEEVRHGLLAAIVPGRRMEPAEAADYMVGILRTLWRYRFFFDALNHLLSDEPVLRARYLALQESIISSAEGAMSSLVAAGEMREPMSPTTTRTLARNWWLMWLGWLSIEQLEHPGLDMVPNRALFEGALQSHSIVQPYFEPGFSAGYLAALTKALMSTPDGNSDGASPRMKSLATSASPTARVRKAASRR